MKIIVKGTDPKDKEFNVMCPYCESVLCVTEKDYVAGSQKMFECPVCSKSFQDNDGTRSNAETAIKKKAEDDRQRLERERIERQKQEYEDYRRQQTEYAEGRPHGGPTGPLPPPSLDILLCIKKVANLSKC